MHQSYFLLSKFRFFSGLRLCLPELNLVSVFAALALTFATFANASEELDDKTQVEELAMNFALGFWKGDIDQVVGTLHPELSKKGVKRNWRRTKKDIMDTLPPDRLAILAPEYNASGRLDQVAKPQVLVHEISDNVAVLELVNAVWFDFFHAVKIDGQWSLLNCVYGSGKDYGLSKQDSDAKQIDLVLRQYAKGIIQNVKEIEAVTHVGLERRLIKTATGGAEYIERSSRSKMLAGAEAFPKPQNVGFKLYNFTNEVAAAKIDFGNWTEYIQLLKLNDEWLIVNSFATY